MGHGQTSLNTAGEPSLANSTQVHFLHRVDDDDRPFHPIIPQTIQMDPEWNMLIRCTGRHLASSLLGRRVETVAHHGPQVTPTLPYSLDRCERVNTAESTRLAIFGIILNLPLLLWVKLSPDV